MAPPKPAHPRPGGLGHRAHRLYLAVVVLLVLALVYLGGRLRRASECAASLARRYGLDVTARASVPRAAALRDLSAAELLAPRTFDEYRAEFDGVVARALALGDFDERGLPPAPGPAPGARAAGLPPEAQARAASLQAACAQALQGGKRLRPIILMEVARLVSARRHADEQMPPADPADAALAVECFHAASLVVDDLPAFDNDAERRGAPAVWAATSESTALMAAAAVMAGAFQNVCRQVDWLRDHCAEWVNADRVGTMLCSQMSASLGALGAAGGQYMDALAPAALAAYGSDALPTLVQRKTAPFFEMAFVCGWLVGGGETGDPRVLEDLQRAGRCFGTAFQIADDIGDLERDRARRAAGKPGWNYADAFGVEEAEAELARRIAACRRVLGALGLASPLWDEIFGKVVKMAA